MNATDVAIYLREHPEFFEDHLDMLATVNVKHPHGNHAIPLVERQVLALEKQVRELNLELGSTYKVAQAVLPQYPPPHPTPPHPLG